MLKATPSSRLRSPLTSGILGNGIPDSAVSQRLGPADLLQGMEDFLEVIAFFFVVFGHISQKSSDSQAHICELSLDL